MVAFIASIISKTFSSAANIVAVPMAVSILGRDVYGEWLAILSFGSLLTFIDLGIPNALINFIATAKSQGDSRRIFEILQSAKTILLLLAVGLLATVPFVAFIASRGLEQSTPYSLTMAIIASVSLIVAPVLNISVKALLGFQQTHVVSIYESIGATLSLFALGSIWLLKGSPIQVIIYLAVAPLITPILITLHVHKSLEIPVLRFSLNRSVARLLISSGKHFAFVQLIAAISFSLSTFLVAAMIDYKSSAELGVTTKLFSISIALTAFVTQPLWPAIRDAISSHDERWIKKAIRRSSVLVSLLSLLCTAPILLFHREIFHYWTSGQVTPGFWLVLSVFIWTNLMNLGGLIATVLNAMGMIRVQATLGVALAVTSILLAIALAPLLGPSGVMLASIVSYVSTMLFPIFWMFHTSRISVSKAPV